MKILVLHSELGVLWGGGETFTTSLFTAFAKRGHRVTAAFVADPSGRYPRELPDCFERLPVPGRWSRKPGQEALSAIGRRLPMAAAPAWERFQEGICWRSIAWHNRRFQRRIESTMAGRWGEYDAVYVNGNVGLAHAAAAHRPTLLMLPGPVSDIVIPLLRGIQAVCAHDDGFSCLRSLLGDRALELPLGLDLDVFHPAPTPVRTRLGWTDREVVFGFVGRLALIKGVDLLAGAFADLSRDVPQARLLIVGSGEEERRIRAVLSREIENGVVHLQNRMSQEELPPWYRAMDVLVMPSRYETMSNAVLEAMACGVPFVASAVGGSRDLAHTGAGWIVPPESQSALTTKLRSLADCASTLKGSGQRGRHFVHEKYSWTSSALRLEHIVRTRLGVNA
jgi:glycosyltransferase involved in cell wall biosynthesis